MEIWLIEHLTHNLLLGVGVLVGLLILFKDRIFISANWVKKIELLLVILTIFNLSLIPSVHHFAHQNFPSNFSQVCCLPIPAILPALALIIIGGLVYFKLAIGFKPTYFTQLILTYQTRAPPYFP